MFPDGWTKPLAADEYCPELPPNLATLEADIDELDPA